LRLEVGRRGTSFQCSGAEKSSLEITLGKGRVTGRPPPDTEERRGNEKGLRRTTEAKNGGINVRRIRKSAGGRGQKGGPPALLLTVPAERLSRYSVTGNLTEDVKGRGDNLLRLTLDPRRIKGKHWSDTKKWRRKDLGPLASENSPQLNRSESSRAWQGGTLSVGPCDN